MPNFHKSARLILNTLRSLRRKKKSKRMKVNDVRVCAKINVSKRVTMRYFPIGAELPQKSTAIIKRINPRSACER